MQRELKEAVKSYEIQPLSLTIFAKHQTATLEGLECVLWTSKRQVTKQDTNSVRNSPENRLPPPCS